MGNWCLPSGALGIVKYTGYGYGSQIHNLRNMLLEINHKDKNKSKDLIIDLKGSQQSATISLVSKSDITGSQQIGLANRMSHRLTANRVGKINQNKPT